MSILVIILHCCQSISVETAILDVSDMYEIFSKKDVDHGKTLNAVKFLWKFVWIIKTIALYGGPVKPGWDPV